MVYFAQLLGMHDHVSYTLAKEEYLIGKYIPYGPVEDVVPYLLRRAIENRDVLGGPNDGSNKLNDRTIIWMEISRRFWSIFGLS